MGDDDVRHLRWLAERIGPNLPDAFVVTTGSEAYRRADGVGVVPAALLGPSKGGALDSAQVRSGPTQAATPALRRASWPRSESFPRTLREARRSGRAAAATGRQPDRRIPATKLAAMASAPPSRAIQEPAPPPSPIVASTTTT